MTTRSAGSSRATSGADAVRRDVVLEGGALDWDGEGTVLTTRECLLNPNRTNPGMTEAKAEALLRETLGMKRVIWIDRGLMNDHTDGHVDNIARFVAPGVVVCQAPADATIPTRIGWTRSRRSSKASATRAGACCRSSAFHRPDGWRTRMARSSPASHMNFLIGNATVVVPTYGTPTAGAAVEALKPFFPGRAVVGLPARHILTGGGAFHCITQQQPA